MAAILETCEFPGCGKRKYVKFMTLVRRNNETLVVCREHVNPGNRGRRRRGRRRRDRRR